MKKLIKVFVTVLLLMTDVSVFSQPVQHFGYVNVIDAMMLHPTMRYFDTSTKRFILAAFKGINIK